MFRSVPGLAAVLLALTWSWCLAATPQGETVQPPPGTQNQQGATQTDDPPASGGQEPTKPEPAPKEDPAESAPKEKDPWEQPTAEDLVDELRRQRPTTEIVRPERTLEEPASERPAGGGQLLPEGTMIPKRLGRAVRDGMWWTFVFESDHPEHPEPPIRLLPNSYLEVMARMARTIPTGLVFEVSGEVSEFEGHNYLLVRSCVRRQGLGNLTK